MHVTDQPLTGVTILDLTRVLAGPYATMMLADLGARVIKVEHPRGGDDTRAWGPPFVNGESTYFLSINRNKESLTLDFKKPRGRAVLDALIDRADVLVENFRPGTLTRMGLDYPSLATTFPRLVYCSISGYGQTGPRREEAGYDAVIQAEGGLMSVTGPPEGPTYRLGIPIADLVTGMLAAQGTLAALFAREHTGRGRHIDIAMLDAVASLMTYQASAYLATGQVPGRFGNGHVSIVPYDTFNARDGQIMLAIGNDQQWRRFCDAAGLPELAHDERFATNPQRVANRTTLVSILEPRIAAQHRAYWIERCAAAGVPCGGVRNVAELLADPQIGARGMITSVHHQAAGDLRLVGGAVRFSDDHRAGDAPPPVLGQHSEAILMKDLGFTREEIASLRAEDVI
jgi:crotonobetainyl-CoA:carnitine CoA-transferase CaiB-like acyl-CoA transferase